MEIPRVWNLDLLTAILVLTGMLSGDMSVIYNAFSDFYRHMCLDMQSLCRRHNSSGFDPILEYEYS